MDKVVIVGGGALGHEVLQIINDMAAAGTAISAKGFVDRAKPELASGIPYLGDDSYRGEPDETFVIAVGEPEIRRRIAANLMAQGVRLATLVHPTAVVAPSARLGGGTVVAAFSFVAIEATLGEHVFLNTYACVGHHVTIGNGTVLSPFATVNGRAVLGESVYLGSHAVVTPARKIGDRAKVAAGSVVYAHVRPDCTVLGNPARRLPTGKD